MGAIKNANKVLAEHQHVSPNSVAPMHNSAVDALEDITTLAEHQKAALRQVRKIIDGKLLHPAEKLDEIDDLLKGWRL